MDLLPSNLYGIEIAISRLRPNARYQLEGTTFTVWEDPSGKKPPTWEEIQKQIAKEAAENEARSLAYKFHNEEVAKRVNNPTEEVKLPPSPKSSRK